MEIAVPWTLIVVLLSFTIMKPLDFLPKTADCSAAERNCHFKGIDFSFVVINVVTVISTMSKTLIDTKLNDHNMKDTLPPLSNPQHSRISKILENLCYLAHQSVLLRHLFR